MRTGGREGTTRRAWAHENGPPARNGWAGAIRSERRATAARGGGTHTGASGRPFQRNGDNRRRHGRVAAWTDDARAPTAVSTREVAARRATALHRLPRTRAKRLHREPLVAQGVVRGARPSGRAICALPASSMYGTRSPTRAAASIAPLRMPRGTSRHCQRGPYMRTEIADSAARVGLTMSCVAGVPSDRQHSRQMASASRGTPTPVDAARASRCALRFASTSRSSRGRPTDDGSQPRARGAAAWPVVAAVDSLNLLELSRIHLLDVLALVDRSDRTSMSAGGPSVRPRLRRPEASA